MLQFDLFRCTLKETVWIFPQVCLWNCFICSPPLYNFSSPIKKESVRFDSNGTSLVQYGPFCYRQQSWFLIISQQYAFLLFRGHTIEMKTDGFMFLLYTRYFFLAQFSCERDFHFLKNFILAHFLNDTNFILAHFTSQWLGENRVTHTVCESYHFQPIIDLENVPK